MKNTLKFCNKKFHLNERGVVEVEIGHLYDSTKMGIPVEVIRGAKEGPVLFLSGAIHGDEINGVEIIRRVIKKIDQSQLKGTVLAVPVVNIFGFNSRSRYLPDRRDLNRSFPGNAKGSLAAQMARKFMHEIVRKSTHGIDFHTGAIHRYNIPQIRTSIDDPVTKAMAKAFHPEVIVNSKLRDGSLREAARKIDTKILLFEGGEALRFDEPVIKSGVRGTLSVMRHLKMLPPKNLKTQRRVPIIVEGSHWIRSPKGGSVRSIKSPGDFVEEGDVLALVLDLFGKIEIEVHSPVTGYIIGQTKLPLVNRGDALFHIAPSVKLKTPTQ